MASEAFEAKAFEAKAFGDDVRVANLASSQVANKFDQDQWLAIEKITEEKSVLDALIQLGIQYSRGDTGSSNITTKQKRRERRKKKRKRREKKRREKEEEKKEGRGGGRRQRGGARAEEEQAKG